MIMRRPGQPFTRKTSPNGYYEEKKMIKKAREKILLVLLPFWDPQIPPLGISCLKGFLQQQGFKVKAIDANTDQAFREIYYRYYKIIEKYVAANRRGNFYNTGNVVLRNHMMAHFTHTRQEQYMELVKLLILKSFDCDFDDARVSELNRVMRDFYLLLERYFLDLLEKEKPGILGFSAFSGTLPASIFASRLAKQRYPGIKTVMGGGVFSDQLGAGTPDLDFFIQKTSDNIDKIFIGEGEILFLKWLQGELPESQKVYTLKDIDAQTVDLTRVKPPDYSDFDLTYYPYIAAYGSRSCPYQCSFCSETVYWGTYRKKDPVQIVKEFTQLHQCHAYQLFMLTDSLLNPIVTELAGGVLKSGGSFYWDGFLRADKHVCNTENTLFWRRGGFYRAKMGIESGSLEILEKMGKKITLTQVKEAVCALAYAGIKTTTFWVIGYPGETEADFQMTLDLLEQLKDDIYEADCNPFYYHLTGQVNSSQWMRQEKAILFYPQWAREMLISQTWRLDCQPGWQETRQRINRFVQHCRKLHIPNPYSMDDVNLADQRWNKLHRNAVPSLLELRDKHTYVEESRKVKKLSAALNPFREDADWL